MCGLLFVSEKTIEKDLFIHSFDKISHRGPDARNIQHIPEVGFMGFHRLAVMDLSKKGNQPFHNKNHQIHLMCNGEIYNFKQLITNYFSNHHFLSQSDCEILLPLYEKGGIEFLCKEIDAEFALCLYDEKTSSIYAARDPMGIRPLFYGYSEHDNICFSSEAKSLLEICKDIYPFPPGHYYENGKFICYNDLTKVKKIQQELKINEITSKIHDLLVKAVSKRLESNAEIGFLLSGGLDSSLVCAIASKKLNKEITTFAIGIDKDPIDVKYAQLVASYLKSNHHEVLFTKDQTITTVNKIIYHLETWDITTIRAAIGMYLLCEYIKKETNIKVLLTGEVSDELFGYKYTDFAPSPEEFQLESAKRIQELYMYDVLRADRCMGAHSLEARVPFGDKEFVQFVMSLDPQDKMNTTGIGKHLLRKAFEKEEYLPHSILYREKAAFSDAVGHSMINWLKEHAKEKYTDEDLQKAKNKYKEKTPFTKESLWYREIFGSYFQGQNHLIKDYWMPNKTWRNCNVTDPSARNLPNYGKSGI